MILLPLPAGFHSGDALTTALRDAGLPGADVSAVGDQLQIAGVQPSDKAKVEQVVGGFTPPAPKPPTDLASRLAAVESELRGMRERAAAVTATGGAAAVRDAITGPAR